MQDMISRYSKELMEYGRRNLSQEDRERLSAAAQAAQDALTRQSTQASGTAPVLYEDFSAAGGQGGSAGRVVFGRGTAAQPQRRQRAVAPQQAPQQGRVVQPRAQAAAPLQEGDDAKKTAQGRHFARLENEIIPLREDDEAIGERYITPAIAAGQDLPDLDEENANPDVLGFSSEDLQQLQDMNARRVENIDVNRLISPTDGRGWLKVQVFSSEARFPLSNARVVVFQTLNGRNFVIYDKLTDINGTVEGLVLPAPHKEYSLSPEGVAGKHSIPYSTYNIYVEHPAFLRKVFPEVSVFDGVDSVKPVILTPRSEGMASTPAIDFYAQG
jgi:hypothetical protein